MRVGLIGSDRLYKIKKPLESVGIECTILNSFIDIFKFRGDIIIVDIAGFRIIFGWLAKKLNKNIILIYRARGDYTRELPKFKEFLISILIKNLCDGIFVVSHSLKKRFLEKNIYSRYIFTVPIPKDIKKYSVEKKSLDYFIIVTITNFDYFDKIRPLYEYASDVNELLLKIGGWWYIAGRGKYAQAFQKYVEKFDRIKYCGYVYVPELLSKASVMIHLSELEGLPNTVLEGMIAKLPVIVNDYKPLKDINHTIVIKNSDELIKWLYILYENPVLRKKIGIKGRKFVENKFNPKNIGIIFKKSLELIYK